MDKRSGVLNFIFQANKNLALSKKKSRKAALQEANLKLTFVPVVFIVLRVWGTLRFLLGNLAHYDSPWISYMQVINLVVEYMSYLVHFMSFIDV